MKSERGNAGAVVVTIIVVIVVLIGGFLGAINQGFVPAPEFLANQPWMESILPPEEEVETEGEVEISLESNLRNQAVEYRSQRDVALATVSDLEQELADKDRLLTARDDEISRLRDTINLAQNSNLNNVALIYENMSPQDASDAMEILGPEQSSLILGAMRESKAAEVMELLDETMVVEITRIMAGFNGSDLTSSPPVTPVGGGPSSPAP